MVRRFAKASEEEIVAINEAAFFIHLIWKILKQLSPSGSVKSGGYIHHYSPPLLRIVVYYFRELLIIDKNGPEC